MSSPLREPYDAVVIGAGMAGLACATRLSEAGRHVVVCEARQVLGGRASSWVDPRVGAELDNGPHLFAGAYREVATLLARVGATARLRPAPRLRVPLLASGGQRAVLEWGAAPGWLGLAQGFARFGVLGLRERAALLAVLAAAGRGRVSADAALGPWLAACGQGPAARRWLWDPLARAAFNDEPERLSARLFAAVVRRLFLGGARAAALAHATVGLSDAYAEPAAAYLAERGSAVLRGVTARAVRATRVGFEVEIAGTEPLVARSACLAVPAERARALAEAGRLAPLPGLRAAAALPHAPLVSCNLWLAGDAPVLDEPFAGFVDGEFSWCLDRTRLAPSSAPGRHVVLIAPGARELATLPPDQIVARARATLAAHAPEAAARALAAARVVKETRAAPSFTPEAARARPAPATAIPGLALAGDWTDTGLPATLEGAALSGHAAARALDAYLGRRGAC